MKPSPSTAFGNATKLAVAEETLSGLACVHSMPGKTPARHSGLIVQNLRAHLPEICAKSKPAQPQPQPLPAPMRFNASNTLSALKKLAVFGAISQTPSAKAQFHQQASARVDVATIDTLQKCDPGQLKIITQNLINQNFYMPHSPILCVERKTFLLYEAWRSNQIPETKTNCYGDALGIADKVHPGGFLPLRATCDAVISGALRDGATRAVNDKCRDGTRQILFFLSENREDYHVISRGADDKTWMQKFSGEPRVPVPLFTGSEQGLENIGITWFKTDARANEPKVERTQSNFTYSQRCAPMLCSLPEKIEATEDQSTFFPPADFYAVRQRQTSIANPDYLQRF